MITKKKNQTKESCIKKKIGTKDYNNKKIKKYNLKTQLQPVLI